MPATVAARPQVPASRTSWVSWGAHHCSLQKRQTVRSEITFTLQDIQTLYEAWNAPPPSSKELQLDTIWNKFLQARECSTHCHNLKKFDLEWLTLERWASLVKISQLPLYQTRIIQPFMQELAVLNKNLAANPRAYMLITLWAFSVSLFVSMLLSVCVAYFEFTKSPRPKGHWLNNPLCANGIFSGYVSLGSEAWSECFIWFWNCELLLLSFFRLRALLHLESQKSFYLISRFPGSRYFGVNWSVLLYLGFAMQRARQNVARNRPFIFSTKDVEL